MSESVGPVKLAVVGSIGIDTIETPFEKREDVLGGSVSYACAASALFTRTGMVGVVGDDFPQEFVDLYVGLGIDLAGLERRTGRTFRWSGVYDQDMINRRTLSTELNVFESFSAQVPATYREAPFVLLGNISPSLQEHVLSQTESATFVLADTMDLWINTTREELMNVIGRVHMLALNDSEARLLTGKYNLRDCARTIMGWGPRYVAIKKGEHGAMLFSEEGIFIVPAYPVNAVLDPTGAGDTFAGAFMGKLAAGGSTDGHAVREALLYGSVVASFGVEGFSLDRLKGLNRTDVHTRFVELQRMMMV